ncbi:Major facilitator superfamily domain general substrate transporter [Penicillium cataractarum]|uniref:Major facilitator superfamily domain general substrate transporter n=1 Tax=Penicillium cataractarum TaxID=2100454 RepID=A0A9X0B6J0_9EURO|nr:Major facilitator superfamily domain general substrate transporter [Penicillium cataractarum]KAJ5390019.1 Major facilitator superfamily domain general substrate transporter [Penicillium cataractarum]
MIHENSDSTSVDPNLAPFMVAVASFANMFCIGTIYALSMLQAQLPRLFGISDAWSFAPFGLASLGISMGVLTSASMIIQNGPHVTVARGTILWGIAVISAGLSLKSLKFGLMLTCFLFGGLGIGWTYLAVVALIGQGLPGHVLARSAIGPLGFSTAAAACFLLSSVFRVDAVDAETLGGMLVFLGVTFAAVGASTQLSLSDFHKESEVGSPSKTLSRDCGPFFSILLFFNALPGMTVFTGLLPLVFHYANGTDYNTMWILSYCMIALALGGVLAPSINAYLGARLTFVGIFCLRGMLLILLSQFEGSSQAMCAMLATLFAHGTGFSILPVLVKRQTTNRERFYLKYSRVLVSWGMSGTVGCIMNSIMLSPDSTVPTGALIVGLLTLSFGTILHLVPALGGEFLV